MKEKHFDYIFFTTIFIVTLSLFGGVLFQVSEILKIADMSDSTLAARCLNKGMYLLEPNAFTQLEVQLSQDLSKHEMPKVVKNAYEKMLEIAFSNEGKNSALAGLLFEASKNFEDSNEMFESLFVTKSCIFTSKFNSPTYVFD